MLVNGLHFRNLRGDLYGGITAAVVALPLALAFGVASGAGPVAGVYGAVFVGFFAALFGGTPAQVSGPTGPMTVVMAAVITRYAHEPALAFTVVMMAGGFQVAFGLLRLGRFINLMPYPVISGFMSGIGCIIIVLQLAPLGGVANPSGQPLEALAFLPEALGMAQPDALVVGVASFVICMFLPARIGRLLPAPLVALVVGVALVATVFGGAPVLGEIPSGLPSPTLPAMELAALPGMIKSALVLALLASIDSLLTSLIADNITRTYHRSDRELVGQGIGNAVAGLMGAIPGAGATMRTVVNVRAGGRTPLSGALHAVLLLGVMLGLGRYAAHIPHAVLAGILIKVGIDIIDWKYLRLLPRAPRGDLLVMLVVLTLTVVVDLIAAVGAGVVMASLLFVKHMADLQAGSIRAAAGPDDHPHLSAEEVALLAGCAGTVRYVHFGGPMSFGAANEMSRRLTGFAEERVLLLDLGDVPFVDTSAALAVGNVVESAAEVGCRVIIAGMSERVRGTLERLGVLATLAADDLPGQRLAAIERAAALAAGGGGARDADPGVPGPA